VGVKKILLAPLAKLPPTFKTVAPPMLLTAWMYATDVRRTEIWNEMPYYSAHLLRVVTDPCEK